MPAGCVENCHRFNCSAQILCIAAQAAADTASGAMGLVCSEPEFFNSNEINTFFQCETRFPRRTNWQRHNVIDHCLCSSNVPAAAASAHCCGASWADEEICGINCLSTSQCETPAALTCRQTCHDVCETMQEDYVLNTCYNQCFANTSSSCLQYISCPPLLGVGELVYDYVCDDGEAPALNGCCQRTNRQGITRESCPSLCRSGRRYIFSHGTECKCTGCPTTQAQVTEELNATVIGNVYEQGNGILAEIAREVDLLHHQPTPRMQVLIRERNDEVLEVMRRVGAVPNSEATAAIAAINERFAALLLAQARRDKALMDQGLPPEAADPLEGPPEAADPLEGAPTRPAGGEEEEDSGPRLGEVAAFVGVLLGICGCCALGGAYVMYSGKGAAGATAEAAAAAAATTHAPQAGDTTVVMGRPVEGAEAAGMAVGAPVAVVPQEPMDAQKGEPSKVVAPVRGASGGVAAGAAGRAEGDP